MLAEGEVRGCATAAIRLLMFRFGSIDSQAESLIQRASFAGLEAIGQRLVAARALQEALGPG